ncbi:MAG: RDD family protein [Bacteroidales bacterium]|nr:RDD family protein [Bacteroidales bacterium]
MEKTNFWLRFSAYLLDSFLVGIIVKYTFVILGYYPKLMSQSKMLQLIHNGNFSFSAIIDVNAFVWYAVISNLLIIFYFTILETSPLQATLFKRLFKIKVVDMEGNRVSFLRAFMRNICKIISTLILSIGFIMALFNKKGQALHDICANCRVIESEK